MELEKSTLTAKMKYVIQCYVSDKKGVTVRISDFTQDQLNSAYLKACSFYGNTLPVPDNGNYEMFV